MRYKLKTNLMSVLQTNNVVISNMIYKTLTMILNIHMTWYGKNTSLTSEQKRLTIVHNFLMQVHFFWEPADSYQLEAINAKKCLLFIASLRINLFHFLFFKMKDCSKIYQKK